MPFRPPLLSLSLLLLTLLPSGCALSVDYRAAALDPPPAVSRVAVHVQDAREVAPPAWVGVARSTMGIPADVLTASGAPLGADLEQVVCAALGENGSAASVAATDSATWVAALAAERAPRGLWLELRRWETDGYFGELELACDLSLRVLDAEAHSLVETAFTGERTIPYQGKSTYERAVLDLADEVLAELFSRPAVRAALEPAAVEAAADPPPSEVPQVEPPPAAGPTCVRCQAPLEPDWRACPACGTSVGAPCAACGEPLQPEWRACPACGAER